MAEEATLFQRLGGRRKLDILVSNFYASVREHAALGPIFAAHVGDWPSHLATVADFWQVQTGGPAEYRGQFLAAHVLLRLQSEHFEAWLSQWNRSCTLHFEPPIDAEMIALAGGLAARLQRSLE